MSFRSVFLVLTLLFLAIPPAVAKVGYHVKVEHLVTGPQFKNRREAVVLSVWPIPQVVGANGVLTTPYVFEGIDLSPLGALKNDPSTLETLARLYISEVQGAYTQIGAQKGLFVIGDTFHKSLMEKESFDDERSAMVAVYEGSALSNPRATFRLAYSTEEKVSLPFVNRLGGDWSRYYQLANKHIIRPEKGMPYDIGSDLGVAGYRWVMDAAKAAYPEVSLKKLMQAMADEVMDKARAAGEAAPANFRLDMEAITSSAPDALYLMALFANDEASFGADTINHELKITNSMGDALKNFLVAKRSIEGGHPAELKGLTHTKGNNGEDYMFAIFTYAAANGFFDRVPANLGLTIPSFFVGETTPAHLASAYRSWNFEELIKVFDPELNGDVSVIQLTRENLSRLFKTLLQRIIPGTPTGIDFTQALNDRAAVLTMEPTKSFSLKAPPADAIEHLRCMMKLGPR